MKPMSRVKAMSLSIIALCATPAFANQSPAGASPSAVPTPAPSRATQQTPIQPWVSACRGDGNARICDAVQSLVDTATQREVVRVAFAKQKSTGLTGILIKTPLGLRLDTGAMLRINGETAGSIDGVIYSRCLADGCYAERPLTPAELTKLTRARTLDVLVLNLQGGPVAISITTTGLAAALNGL